MTDSNEPELDALAARIDAISEEALKQDGSLLLSRLGGRLGADLTALRQNGKSLGAFLLERFPDKYSLIKTGIHNNVLMIVDASDSALAAAISAPDSNSVYAVPKSFQHPRYNKHFWAAFSVPPTKKYRYVDLNTLLFRESDEDNKSSSEIEVKIELIPAADAEDRDDLINRSITRWIEENKLDHSKFLRPTPISPIHPQVFSGRSVLTALIEVLDKRQLQSTSLSLDVVQTLINKKI